MSEFTVGDQVQDVIWDGAFTGTVQRVDADGNVYVQWHGVAVEDQMRPHQITHLPDGAR